MARVWLVWALATACSNSEPTAPAPTLTPHVEARHTVTSPPRLAVPELPSIANPPGVPHVDGELQTDRDVSFVDIVVGEGGAPEKGQLVKFHYTGWLADGTKVDSSVERGEPITVRFDSGQIIKGFDIGLASMRVGGTRRIVIPPELGYGSTGRANIPADSTLVFDVELIDAREP
jgi:peptidylprolyl isomerase